MINAFCTYTINLQKERDMKNFFILFIIKFLDLILERKIPDNIFARHPQIKADR